ncbi:MAG TPA: hypothetical protein VIR54_24710 [Vicinamibacterales bacterium]
MLRQKTRIARCALPMIVLLASAPSAFSESLDCHPIRRGESAAQVARRITGDSRDAYQSWFQIRNASSRFVPKSQYHSIRAGWQACLLKPIVQRASAKVEDVVTASVLYEALPMASAPVAPAVPVTREPADGSTGLQSAAFVLLRAIGGLDFPMVWLGAAMVVPWVGWRFMDDYLVRKKTRTIVMQHFATRFVQEFERPLRLSEADRPVRSRVRYSARRGRLDILLAPGRERRYPNLSDHKKNMEYDVARIVRALADRSFVNGPLYTQAGWVVVPFQFLVRPGRKGRKTKTGVTCISFF